MTRRDLGFAALAVIAAAACVRLGVWQLDRLSERRTINAGLRARAAMAPVDISALPTDTAKAHYRRVRVAGRYDFDRELIVTSRSRQGSPGVHIVTPVIMPGSDTAILVNRGWIYAPDGMTADLTRWREPSPMTGDAYIENFPQRQGAAKLPRHRNAYRWLDRSALSRELPYPIAPWYAVLIAPGTETPANIPPRLDVPPLDEGPHRSYAIQWFSFATISIIGMTLYLRRK